jgi:hypothetical protein
MTLDANINNSKVIQKSSSIKISIKCAIPISFINIKVMVIVACKTLKSNQCPWD